MKSLIVGLALCTGSLAGAQDSTARAPADTTHVVARAPANAQWTVVKAENWLTDSPNLVGKYVEFSGGGLATQLIVNRTSEFDNSGWLIDADGRNVGLALFDQTSDDVFVWMSRAKCHLGCRGVFVRGMPVYVDKRPASLRARASGGRTSTTPPILRVLEVSYESSAGVAAAGAAALDIAATDPRAQKPLLPPGVVPNRDATGPAGTSLADAHASVADSAKTDTASKKGGGFMGLLRAVGSNMKAHGGGLQRPKAAADGTPPEGKFRFGDPPLLATYYRNIRDTELNQIFAASQWNVGRNSWPRVALVVEDVSQATGTSVMYAKYGSELRNQCWRLSARVWTGPAASKDIPSFNWCLTEMHYDTTQDRQSGATFVGSARIGLGYWGMTPKTSMMDENTGPNRTMGPNPPYTPVMRFHFRDDTSGESIMLGNILRDMAFSYGVPDGRVWVVKIPGQ